MGAGDESPEDQQSPSQAFAAALAALKREGAAVLVVGDVPESVGQTACTRLFGERTSPPRHRIAVSTTPSAPPLTSGGGSGDLSRVTHLTYTSPNRHSASPDTSGVSDGPRVDRDCDSLAELGVAITETIADIERTTGGLAPAQLRVGFDSIRPLLDDDEATAFRFLHVLTGRVTSVDGMIHVPLLEPITGRVVQTFAPLFDALIELRVIDGVPHQRWRFPSRDVSSEWLEL